MQSRFSEPQHDVAATLKYRQTKRYSLQDPHGNNRAWVEMLKSSITSKNTFFSFTTEPFVEFFRFPQVSTDIESAKLLWLIRLRWLAIFGFFLLSVPAYLLDFLNSASFTPYIGTLSVLTLLNLMTHLNLVQNQKAISPLRICFHMTCDLAALTALLALTKGTNNPLIALFLLNTVLGGLLISSRLSWSFLFIVHTLMAFLQLQFYFSYDTPLTNKTLASFACFHFLIFSFFLIARSLGIFLEKQYSLQIRAQSLLEKQDRLRSIGALSAGFSHEFSSPLNTIKLRLERILRKSSQENFEDIHEALLAVDSCTSVVKQMNSSQLDNRDFQFRNIDVTELIEEVLKSWLEDKPNVLIYRKFAKLPNCLIPPVNFTQALLNLLDNAYEAAPESPIDITLENKFNSIQLSLRDYGPGFSSHVMSHIGEPFVTTKKQGTGLGLYVSQLFCQSLGGSFSAKNHHEKGAVVKLQWPAKESDEA